MIARGRANVSARGRRRNIRRARPGWLALTAVCAIAAGTAGGIVFPTGAAAQHGRELHTTRARPPADSTALARPLHVEISHTSGRVEVAPAAGGTLYDVRARYDPAVVRTTSQFDDATHTLTVATTPADGSRLFGIHMGGVSDEAAPTRNTLAVALPPAEDVHLSVHLRAGEGELDVGGLTLSDLELSNWGSALELRFGAPNRTTMRRLVVSSTMASVDATGLANAHVEAIHATVTAGGLDLDFGPVPWTADVNMHLRVLLGGVDIRLPESVGVRLIANTRAASIDGLIKRDAHTWTSSNWETAERKLTIDARVTGGGISIERSAAP